MLLCTANPPPVLPFSQPLPVATEQLSLPTAPVQQSSKGQPSSAAKVKSKAKVKTSSALPSTDQLLTVISTHDSPLEAPATPPRSGIVAVDSICTDESDSTNWLAWPMVLPLEDRERLNTGKWLNCRVIEAAQKLISKQFPELKGLQSPICGETLSFRKAEGRFVQILNIQNHSHWITASNVGCEEGTANIYDSAYNSLTMGAKAQICSLWRPSADLVTLRLANIQRQPNNSDCGLFSIACATEVAFSRDPTLCYWDVGLMRGHLASCLEKGKMEVFPLQKPRRQPVGRVFKKNLLEKIYCICRMPNYDRDIPMVKCGVCKRWFHKRCVGLDEDADIDDLKWICYKCH